MTEKAHNKLRQAPVIFVFSNKKQRLEKKWLKRINTLSDAIYTYKPWLPKQNKSLRGLAHSIDQLGRLTKQISKLHPGRAILFLRDGLQLPDGCIGELQRLQQRCPGVLISCLSNADPDLNPFCDLEIPPTKRPDDYWSGLVAWASERYIFEHQQTPKHLLYLDNDCIAQIEEQTDLASLSRGTHPPFYIADYLFAYAPDQPIAFGGRLKHFEQRRPAPFAYQKTNLLNWLSQNAVLSSDTARQQPTTLHISHSWGGGIQRWIQDFCAADSGRGLVLEANEPQLDAGHGQRLSLYLHQAGKNILLRQWWLQPAIQSTALEHAQYQSILQHITQRFAVGRIVVSSLIGHSLDVLSSGLPTLQILHDYYPVWPLLSKSFTGYRTPAGSIDIQTALQQLDTPEFPDQDAQSWQMLSQHYLEAISEVQIRLAAPSQTVIDNLCQLDPSYTDLAITLQPHGIASEHFVDKAAAKNRPDQRLTLVILGRLQENKGKQTFLDLHAQLTDHAQIFLLGCGNKAEAFYGLNGVNIIPEYHWQELPALLREIGPDAGLLLSTVEETFSYTLSELMAMGIPPIATPRGALAERIQHGVNGLLSEPEALPELLAQLRDQPGTLEAIREEIEQQPVLSVSTMVEAYQALCPIQDGTTQSEQIFPAERIQISQLAQSNTQLNQQNQQQSAKIKQQGAELRKRADWALKREAELKKLYQAHREINAKHLKVEALRQTLAEQVQEQRQTISGQSSAIKGQQEQIKQQEQVIQQQEQGLAYQEQSLQQQQQAIRQQQQAIDERGQHIDALSHSLEAKQAEYEDLLASRSWRLTKPLRVVTRLSRKTLAVQAYNPLRWPGLIRRLLSKLRTLGIKRTLWQLQAAPEVTLEPVTELAPAFTEIAEQAPKLSFSQPAEAQVSVVILGHNRQRLNAALSQLHQHQTKTVFAVHILLDQALSPGEFDNINGVQWHTNSAAAFSEVFKLTGSNFIFVSSDDYQIGDYALDKLLLSYHCQASPSLITGVVVTPTGDRIDSAFQRCSEQWVKVFSQTDLNHPASLATRRVTVFENHGFLIDAETAQALLTTADFSSAADLCQQAQAQEIPCLIQPQAVFTQVNEPISGSTLAAQSVTAELLPDKHEHVLVIDAYTPMPDQDSGSLRMYHLLLCLRDLGYGVTFFADDRQHAGRYTEQLQAAGIETWYQPQLMPVKQFFSEHGSKFGAVILSRYYVAENHLRWVQQHCPKARIIFDTVDLHYLREQRLAKLNRNSHQARTAEKTKASEFALMRTADCTLVVSDFEQALLNKELPEAYVDVVSNIHLTHPNSSSFEQRKDILFVGGYQHPPNVDAALWLVNEIMPLVQQQLPDARLHLVGSKAPPEVQALAREGVLFHGYVQDLAPFLRGCRLAVAPLRYGAGVKGKVNSSMSYGQPVVATTIATEGMFTQHEHDVLVADASSEFARQIVRLYTDPKLWDQLSKNGYENVRQYFSVAMATQNLQRIFSTLKI